MKINHVDIDETYAEGFFLYASRILITADSLNLAKIAAQNVTGYATSTIHCDCEAGIDMEYGSDATPDSRPGVSVIFCVQGKKKMDELLLNRIGQCVLTSATTACFDWFPTDIVSEKTFEVKTGFKLKFFGDGFEQKESMIWNKTNIPMWKIPMMDGYFLVQETIKVTKIAAGGNFMVFGKDIKKTISACQEAVLKMNKVKGVVLPFPGGYVRSPSKIGSKYSFLSASTNEKLSPILRETVPDTKSPPNATVGFEFVINGFSIDRIESAMKVGIQELCSHDTVLKITAGNYGGKLGKIKFELKKILS